MKIGVKLIVVISICNIVGIGILAGATLINSQREISHLSDEQARALAAEGGEKIRNWFNTSMDASRTLAQVMEGYKKIPVEERRGYFDFMLQQVLFANPTLWSAYSNWGETLLDGLDEQYANTPGNDNTGRYIPTWTRGTDGNPVVNAITGFPLDAVIALTGGNEFVLDPAPSRQEGVNDLIVNFIIPIKDNGKVVGCTGNVIRLSTIQALADEIKPFGDGYALVFSNGGKIAAHTDASQLGKDMRETETDTFGGSFDMLVDAVTTGKAVSFSVTSAQSNTVMRYYAVPFTLGNFAKPWSLVVGVPQATIMVPVYRMLIVNLAIGVVVILGLSFAVFFIARSISNPIATLTSMLKDISEGEGDLTKSIQITAQNELGDLAHYFNLTIQKIKNLVLAIKREAAALVQTGTDLASNMTETTASINQITAHIRGIESQIANQSISVKGTTATMGEVADTIETLNTYIQKQTECVNQSSSAVEEMLANIRSVTQTLVKNGENVTKLAQASEVGRNGLEEVSGDIQEIARDSEGLLEINAVIENIASQTNLLSMNAAIEAAHAGDAGKGFAVVADEIRKLAESSSEQSKTISAVLNKIKNSIDKIMKSTSDVLTNFEAINAGMRVVTEQEMNIRTAMEEQGTGSKQILGSIENLQEITSEVQRSAEAMREGNRGIIRESEVLERITVEIRNRIQEMTSGADQINITVHRVNDISMNNKQQIEVLTHEVSRFRVE